MISFWLLILLKTIYLYLFYPLLVILIEEPYYQGHQNAVKDTIIAIGDFMNDYSD